MANSKKSPEMRIDASPTKTFFVDMLTRDIELEDAILDLLDNCIDGIQRTIDGREESDQPYAGFWAEISFSGNEFKIADNCGGIPLNIAQEYAFRMGRPTASKGKDLHINAIGTYGIGMKRAIFKMGRSCTVTSQTDRESFCVNISPAWTQSDEWILPFERIDRTTADNGTIIHITEIQAPIQEEFSSPTSTLNSSLIGKISHHYSYILKKGFTIFVNGQAVPQSSFELLWEGVNKVTGTVETAIAPYLYKAEYDGVSIELAVGFYRQTASPSEIKKEKKGTRSSSENAGWTIICNDRVVVYRDKTRLTGWGEAGIPNYHPQFISIAGTVHFRCNEAHKLPITTTKRGLDVSSELYLYTKDFMRKGLKVFTSYTNRWKDNPTQEKKVMKKTQQVDPNAVFGSVAQTAWTKTKRKSDDRNVNIVDEQYYTPSLPVPTPIQNNDRDTPIRFSRKLDEIRLVAQYLFEDEDRDPGEVADECFDILLKEAQDSEEAIQQS
jgi:Histidine kinase-, DNA gyrase B-, and HSP90-like ATPase